MESNLSWIDHATRLRIHRKLSLENFGGSNEAITDYQIYGKNVDESRKFLVLVSAQLARLRALKDEREVVSDEMKLVHAEGLNDAEYERLWSRYKKIEKEQANMLDALRMTEIDFIRRHNVVLPLMK
ncbi:hypothetical protein RUND412_001417 [Rhizina undulata]